MRELSAAGGDAVNALTRYVDMMRRFQGIEGITLLDANDSMEATTHGGFSGLSDALQQFGQQLSGALQIPLVRLFGQSPMGFNSGDSDLRNYYDNIRQQQIKQLLVPVTRIYRAIAASEDIELPEGFGVEFKSLWQMSDLDKANVASTVAQAVQGVESAGLISQASAMKELRQSSEKTGVFTNITDEEIEEAEVALPPSGEGLMSNQEEFKFEKPLQIKPEKSNLPEPEPSSEEPKSGSKNEGLKGQKNAQNI